MPADRPLTFDARPPFATVRRALRRRVRLPARGYRLTMHTPVWRALWAACVAVTLGSVVSTGCDPTGTVRTPDPEPPPLTLALVHPLAATGVIGRRLLPSAAIVGLRQGSAEVRLSAGLRVRVTAATPSGAPLPVRGDTIAASRVDGLVYFTNLVMAGPPGPRLLTFTALDTAVHAVLTVGPIAFAPDTVSPTRTTLTLTAASVVAGGMVTATLTPVTVYGTLLGVGHAVTIAVAAPGGAPGTSTAAVSAVTDVGDGTYTARLTGVRSGRGAPVTATIDSVPLAATAQPTLTITPGAARQVTVTAGNAQTALAGTVVAIAPAVQVTDSVGNTVPGAAVTFTVATGGGTLQGARATTDSTGTAVVGGWTLGGAVGSQTLAVQVAGLAQSVAVTATATAGSAAQLLAGRDSLLLGALGAGDTVTAVVQDARGNVVPTATIAWSVSDSTVVGLRASGRHPDGTQWVQIAAKANGLALVTATSGALQRATKAAVRQAATRLAVTTPGAALGTGDTTSLAVSATDANGNAVPRPSLVPLTFRSSDTTVVAVDTTGRVRGIGPGTAAVTVTSGTASSALTAVTGAITVTSAITYADFCTLSGLNLIGSTARAGCALRLTPAAANQTGGVWQPALQKLDGGFETTFRFQVSQPGSGGADGFALVIQSVSNTATGALGGGIGYPGLTRALAVEFDTYMNGANNDPNDNHVAVQSCGAGALTAVHDTTTAGAGCTWGPPTPLAITLKDGRPHTVRVAYVPGTLAVYVDGATAPALTAPVTLTNLKGASILDAQGRAWIGFTAATGGSWENHDLLSWSLTPSR